MVARHLDSIHGGGTIGHHGRARHHATFECLHDAAVALDTDAEVVSDHDAPRLAMMLQRPSAEDEGREEEQPDYDL